MTSRASGSSSAIRHFHVLTGLSIGLLIGYRVKFKFERDYKQVRFRKNLKIVLTRIEQLQSFPDVAETYAVVSVAGFNVIRLAVHQFKIQYVLFQIGLKMDPGLIQYFAGAVLEAIFYQRYEEQGRNQ